MPTATNTHTTPTRRFTLGFSIAALAAGLAVPTSVGRAHTDAELIALCADFHRQHQVVLGVGLDDDDGMDVAILARWDISNKIEDIAPVTPTGRKAKAGIALFLLEENYGPAGCKEGSSMRLAVAALRDIAGSDAA
jgi:hypothetical protein